MPQLGEQAANTIGHDVWSHITADIRTHIMEEEQSQRLPSLWTLGATGSVPRLNLTRSQRVHLEWPFDKLFAGLAGLALVILMFVTNAENTGALWFWASVVSAAGIFSCLSVPCRKIRRDAQMRISTSDYFVAGMYLHARDAYGEICKAAKAQLPGAVDILTAAEEVLPDFEKLLESYLRLERAWRRNKGSLVSGNYGQALVAQAKPIKEALLATTTDLLAAARILFAARPDLLVAIQVDTPTEQEAAALEALAAETDAVIVSLTGSRAKLAAAAQTITDQQ